jgi:hypothetical protein
MSINWSPKYFLQMLKHQVVSTEDLKIGDVVDDDYGYFQVASIEKQPDGTVMVLDEDRNGNSGERHRILDRSLFDEDRGPNARECHCGVKLIPRWRHQQKVCNDCFEMAGTGFGTPSV